MSETIAFLGLGNLGTQMAQRLPTQATRCASTILGPEGPCPSTGVNDPLPPGNRRGIAQVFARAMNPCVVATGRCTCATHRVFGALPGASRPVENSRGHLDVSE